MRKRSTLARSASTRSEPQGVRSPLGDGARAEPRTSLAGPGKVHRRLGTSATDRATRQGGREDEPHHDLLVSREKPGWRRLLLARAGPPVGFAAHAIPRKVGL